MDNILQRIAACKRREVVAMQKVIPAGEMRERAVQQSRVTLDLAKAIGECGKTAVISEFKRRSPSKGEIAPCADVVDVVPQYVGNGAAALSVLTDTRFFGGAVTDLEVARCLAPSTPILRKDFIVDEYQIHQSRLIGADAILLIASILDSFQLGYYFEVASGLGLSVLFEIHDASEVGKLPSGVRVVGVNNRDLRNFHTDIENSLRLVETLPPSALKIAESGIKTPGDIARLKKEGFDGFLIGESLIASDNPGKKLKEFIG